MYKREYFSTFVATVCRLLDINTVVWIEEDIPQFKKNEITLKGAKIRQIRSLVDSRETKVRIITFDIHLIPVIASVRYIEREFKRAGQPYEFCFVQHGTFSDLSVIKRKDYNFQWIKRSVGSMLLLLSTLPLRDLFKGCKICIRSLLFGSFSCRQDLAELTPKFRLGVFWNPADLDLLGEETMGRIEEVVLTSPPDRDRLELVYNSNAPILYISQPLHEDNLVSEQSLFNFLEEIYQKYPNLQILLHPRSREDLYSSFPQDRLTRMDKEYQVIQASKILGHFSSLLLSVPKSMDLETYDLDSSVVKQSIDKFRIAYDSNADVASLPKFSELKHIIEG
jgi:hypothetical protein